jgi:hypothetical protein
MHGCWVSERRRSSPQCGIPGQLCHHLRFPGEGLRVAVAAAASEVRRIASRASRNQQGWALKSGEGAYMVYIYAYLEV